MYKNDFIEAVERTNRLGLTPPDIGSYVEQSFLQKTNPEQLASIIYDEFGQLTAQEVVAQCLSLHFRLKPIFEAFFNSPVFYTIGYVEFETSSKFKQTEASLARLLKEGAQQEVNIHAWLTLPSMEVLDFSLATSYAVLNNRPEGIGTAIAERADNLKGMSYKPLVVGEDFLIKSKILREF